MQSRRNFIGKVATGLAGTLAARPTCWAPTTASASASSAPGDRGTADPARSAGLPQRRMRRRRRRLHQAPGRGEDDRARRQDLPRLPLPARRQVDRRGPDRHAAAPALRALRRRARRRQARLPGKDDGVHGGARQADARRLPAAPASAPCRSATSALLLGPGAPTRGASSTPELMGKITAIHAHMYRNTPHGKPQWSRPVYPDMTPENIIWKSFLGEAPQRPFDANRYVNWRFFWDYSGGNVYENMCHQLAFWYKVLDLQIPQRRHHDRRRLPLEGRPRSARHHERRRWSSPKRSCSLGTPASATTSSASARTCSAPTAPFRAASRSATRRRRSTGRDGNEMVGQTRTATRRAHMQNFLDCVRGGKEPNCPFEVGFRVSIACRMAVESYRQERTVRWDSGEGRDRLSAYGRHATLARPAALSEDVEFEYTPNRFSCARRCANSPRRRSRPTSWSGTRRRLSRSKSSKARRRSATWGRSSRRNWAAPGSATSSTPSSSRNSRAWTARSGIIVAAHTSLCSNHIYKIGHRRAAPHATSRSWPPASGSAAGRSPSPKPAPTPPAPAPRAVPEDGCWVLNGAKTFTTNAHYADVCVAMAVTDRAAAQHGISAFIIEKDTPGFRAGQEGEQARAARQRHRRSDLRELPACPRRSCWASATKASWTA